MRVHRVHRVHREKVLKIDRPFRAGGFLSLTALRAEGCGIARRAMSMKSALRDLLSVSYGMKSILRIGSLRSPPYPAAPDFPPSGGQNKTPRSLASSAQRLAKNKVPPPGGRWWRQPPKGVHFLARQGGCMVSLRAKARLYSFPAPSVVP